MPREARTTLYGVKVEAVSKRRSFTIAIIQPPPCAGFARVYSTHSHDDEFARVPCQIRVNYVKFIPMWPDGNS